MNKFLIGLITKTLYDILENADIDIDIENGIHVIKIIYKNKIIFKKRLKL